jgi:hypothetical protein
MAPPVRSGWGRGAAGSFPQTPREPHATKAEIVGKIIYLRRSYHFGPHKIAMYQALPRHRDQPLWGGGGF